MTWCDFRVHDLTLHKNFTGRCTACIDLTRNTHTGMEHFKVDISKDARFWYAGIHIEVGLRNIGKVSAVFSIFSTSKSIEIQQVDNCSFCRPHWVCRWHFYPWRWNLEWWCRNTRSYVILISKIYLFLDAISFPPRKPWITPTAYILCFTVL